MKRKNSLCKKSISIQVKVEPRSSKAGIVGRYREGIKVRLTSPPVEGRANKELIHILSKTFGIKKEDVEIISGRKSKNKVVVLHGVDSFGDKIL
jgi:hypothetical protein